jgi:hypothetical protein
MAASWLCALCHAGDRCDEARAHGEHALELAIAVGDRQLRALAAAFLQLDAPPGTMLPRLAREVRIAERLVAMARRGGARDALEVGPDGRWIPTARRARQVPPQSHHRGGSRRGLSLREADRRAILLGCASGCSPS